MSKQIQDAYIVAAARTPIGKAPRGAFRSFRPDDLLVHAIRAALAQVPGLDPATIEDAIVGCAIPEAEQGLNVARIGALLSGLPDSVGGVTVNRFCASGLTAIAMAADRIRVGEAEVMITVSHDPIDVDIALRQQGRCLSGLLGSAAPVGIGQTPAGTPRQRGSAGGAIIIPAIAPATTPSSTARFTLKTAE